MRKVSEGADVFDELHNDLLYQLECSFPKCNKSASTEQLIHGAIIPLLGLLYALKIVLPLQLCDEGVIGGDLTLIWEAMRYGRCDTPLLRRGGCHPI